MQSLGRLAHAILILALYTACEAYEPVDDRQVFRYNESAGISSLDPAFARSQSNIWACKQIYNTLVELDPQLKLVPGLAERWEILDSGRHYRFYLRPEVYFHADPCFGESPRRLKASDVKFSLERLRDPALAAPGAWTLKMVDSIAAADAEGQLDIYLRSSFPPFLGILSMQYCGILAPEALSYYGKNISRQPVGTGPFYLRFWEENEKMVLRRNPRYFERDEAGQALPYLEAVAIRFVPDKQAAFMEFLKGNNDFLSGLDPSYKDELLDGEGRLKPAYQKDYRLYRQDYLNTEYLAFRLPLANSPYGDVRVRRAMNYAANRPMMLRYLRNNIGTSAEQGMIPRGLAPYDSSAGYGYGYDPQKAASLLAEAGYPKGEGLPQLVLHTNAGYLDLCEFLQSEWAKLGFPIKVELSPPSTLRQAMATGKVDFFRASWIADYPDAENYLSLFYSPNKAPDGPNYSHFHSTVFDSLYQRALEEQNDERRWRLYRQMDSLVMQSAAVIPLYYDQVLRFVPKRVRGLQANPLNLLDLRRVRKD